MKIINKLNTGSKKFQSDIIKSIIEQIINEKWKFGLYHVFINYDKHEDGNINSTISIEVDIRSIKRIIFKEILIN